MKQTLREQIIDMCNYVIEKDKTPEYDYGGKLDTKGNKPPVGSRWMTPRQYCENYLRSLDDED